MTKKKLILQAKKNLNPIKFLVMRVGAILFT